MKQNKRIRLDMNLNMYIHLKKLARGFAQCESELLDDAQGAARLSAQRARSRTGRNGRRDERAAAAARRQQAIRRP